MPAPPPQKNPTVETLRIRPKHPGSTAPGSGDGDIPPEYDDDAVAAAGRHGIPTQTGVAGAVDDFENDADPGEGSGVGPGGRTWRVRRGAWFAYLGTRRFWAVLLLG